MLELVATQASCHLLAISSPCNLPAIAPSSLRQAAATRDLSALVAASSAAADDARLGEEAAAIAAQTSAQARRALDVVQRLDGVAPATLASLEERVKNATEAQQVQTGGPSRAAVLEEDKG